jgi:ABC-type glycerol-3-phosphate transport system substrate-binding protein
MFKRFLCLLLSALMLLAALAGCKKKEEPKDTTPAVTENTDDAISDGLPDDLNYGKTVTVLATESQMNKTYVTDLTGTPMNDALYKRLAATEERLGVSFEFIPCAHAWEDASNYTDIVRNDMAANSVSEFDLFMSYNLLPSLMITNGYLSDLSQSKYLDTEQPWWPQNMFAEATIDDKLYYVVDNCSWGSIRNMACIVFNKDLANAYSISESTLSLASFS